MGHTSPGRSSEITEKHAVLMNCLSAAHSSDAYHFSCLIFPSHQELGVDIWPCGKATVLTNWDASQDSSAWDMPSARCCQLSLQSAVMHPQPATDTAPGSVWKERTVSNGKGWGASQHLLYSHVQSFSGATRVLFLLTAPFRLGMKLIYCYTDLKYLFLKISFAVWLEPVLQQESWVAHRQQTEDCTATESGSKGSWHSCPWNKQLIRYGIHL